MRSRTLLVAAWTAAVALLVALGPTRSDLPLASDGSAWQAWLARDPEHALTTGAGLLAWLVLLWLAVGFLAVIGSRGAGRTARWSQRLARILLPRLVRGGLEAAIGLTVV